MNRKIAAMLVGLSILAGAGVGFVVQHSQDTPASAKPKPSASKSADGPQGGESTTGPVKVTGAFLVASRTAGATLVATLRGPSGVTVDGITAEIDGRTLPVALGYDGDSVGSNTLDAAPLHLGAKGVKVGGFVETRTAYVVHDAKVGQHVQVTLDLNGASDVALDVPVVDADQVKDVALFEGPPPKFTNAKIVVFPGEEKATLGYTIVSGNGRSEGTTVDRLTVWSRDGIQLNTPVEHHTATGGPSGIGAFDKPETVVAARPGEGDFDYVDAGALKVGQTITIHFPFAGGVSVVPFKVVAG